MLKLSLKNKLILSIILTIVFFGGLADFIVFVKSKNTILEVAEKKLEIIDSEKVDGLSDILRQGRDLANILSNRGEIIKYLSNSPELQDEKILDFLNGYNVGGVYSAIYVMASDGTAMVSTDPTFTGNNYGFRDYFKEAINGKEFMDIAIGVTSKKMGYYFSSPIKSTEGEIIGVVVAKMTPERFHKSVHLSETRGEMSVMLVNVDGVIVYSSDESKIYKSLGALTKEKLNIIEDKKIFSGVKIEPLTYDFVLEQLPGVKNNLVIKLFDELDEKDELLVITKIPSFPLFLISEHDLWEFVSSSASISYVLGCFVALAAISALLIIILLVNNFLKPLIILDEGVHKIGEGDFDYRINIKSGDELERLAGHINGMAKKLKILQEEIKKKLIISTRINKILVGRELAMKELKKENEILREELKSAQSHSKVRRVDREKK